jgi:MFS family permease
MVSAPLFGWLGDRRGYRLVFCIAVACGAAFSLVGLSLPLWSQPVYGFCLCYALAGLAGTAGFIAAFNMTFEFADVHSRSLYIAVVATLSSVVVVVVGGVGGKLVDCFGHGPLLAASAVVNLWAGLMVVWLLPEPRRLVPAQIATHVERV